MIRQYCKNNSIFGEKNVMAHINRSTDNPFRVKSDKTMFFVLMFCIMVDVLVVVFL